MSNSKVRRRTTVINFWPGDARVSMGSNGKTYEGRLLGLITDKEFAALIDSPEVQKKCYTSATTPLSDIVDNYEELDGYRMVLAVKKVDNRPIIGQKLFITERLSLVSYLSKNKCAGITGLEGAYMMMEEDIIENET